MDRSGALAHNALQTKLADGLKYLPAIALGVIDRLSKRNAAGHGNAKQRQRCCSTGMTATCRNLRRKNKYKKNGRTTRK
jgi:hypothetical protein